MKTNWKQMLALAGAASVWLLAGQARADDDDSWYIRNKIDEDLQLRDNNGLSKLRTLGQSDVDKSFHDEGPFSNVKVHVTLRASYDGAYELNSTQFGDNAGTSVYYTATNPASPAYGVTYPNGSAPIPLFGGGGVVGGGNFGVEPLYKNFPNDLGVNFAVPVRPCNVDHRGCIPGYMDYNEGELAAEEFDPQLDFLREAYTDLEMPLAGNTLDLRIGRQQLVWGRTDLFRVLDVVNPVDYSRNNIYDELEDIRIPMGMARADYRMGAVGPFDDLNVQGVWVFEDFRPNNLGQGGSVNQPLQAASLFRALANCWQLGCTVNNFTPQGLPVNFGPHEIGIRQADVPSGISHDAFGGKVEGELKGVGFSLNVLSFQSQMPSLRGGLTTVDPFSGNTAVYPYSLAFDIHFPRLTMYGGSLDYALDSISTAFRLEATYTQGEEFANTTRPQLYSASNVFRFVIGADRNTFIRFLNPTNAFLFSAQLFGTHIVNYQQSEAALGPVGMPNPRDDFISTLLIKGWYKGQTISPQVKIAYDYEASAGVVDAAVDWLPSNHWKFTFGGNAKFGSNYHTFDDDSSAAPYPELGGPAASAGWGGMRPLGIFANGVLGMAHYESYVYANASYRF